MSTSRVPAVMDGLVALLKANLAKVDVFDGPPLQAPAGDYVCVGWAPSQSESASSEQDYATLARGANLRKDEQLDVTCYADTMTGDTSGVKGRRDAAYAVVAQVEAALRTDPTLSGVVVGWLQVASTRLLLEQTESGLIAGVEFHVVGRARI